MYHIIFLVAINLHFFLGVFFHFIIGVDSDFRCDAIHHDGTNHYLYRVYKDGVSETQIDNLKEKIYYGKATRADIVRVTRRLGDDIAKVYGFPIPRQRQTAVPER